MRKLLAIIVLGLLLQGCAEGPYLALNTYDQQKHTVRLGDSINTALPALKSMQSSLTPIWLRPAEQYLKGGSRFYIHFQRTGWIEDHVLTDDEFTPYVFANDKLVAIGWTVLGGARTSGSGATAAAINELRGQALMDLSNSLRQPQTNYNPPNTSMRCTSSKTAFGQIVTNCK